MQNTTFTTVSGNFCKVDLEADILNLLIQVRPRRVQILRKYHKNTKKYKKIVKIQLFYYCDYFRLTFAYKQLTYNILRLVKTLNSAQIT